jgi:hypothetical protein
MNNNIRENSFDAAPGGMGGSMGGNLLGTHSSPTVSQNPAQFHDSDNNKYFDKNKSGQPDTRVHDDSGSLSKDVDQLFKAKEKPTIDDVTTGIQYELGNMIKKDKRIAKERVVDNMKKYGPKYYSGLGMLNINDKDMDVSPVMQERINVLNQMIEDKKVKREALPLNDAIKDILKEKLDMKNQRTDDIIRRTF